MSNFRLVAGLLLIPGAFGFLFNFNSNNQQQQEQSRPKYEELYLDNDCNGYLCPDTMECVLQAKDCPCPFQKSQLKCVLPNDRYICISKPATHDEALNAIYDDTVRGPKAANKGIRDCGWVLDAYKGLV